MKIHPTPAGFTPKPGPGRAQEKTPLEPVRPQPQARVPADEPASDRVELSAEARALNCSQAADAAGGRALAAERLRQIADRMRTGHYGRPDVIERVVDRLLDDLNGPTPSQ